jgi:hypothetical protein
LQNEAKARGIPLRTILQEQLDKGTPVSVNAQQMAHLAAPEQLQADIEAQLKRLELAARGGYAGYSRLAGEAEARNVETRRYMTLEERRATPPWKTQDVPDEQQIVRFRTEGPQASIKAYHGSPHDFDRFDSSKIGTGEGAQAYGHGLYFAEREGVAKEYRDKLSYKGMTIDGQPLSKTPSDAEYWADRGWQNADNGDPEKAVSFLQSRSPANSDDYRSIQEAIQLITSGRAKPITGGSIYEVDIAADPEHFLDFDAPISAQPPQAQDLLQSLHKYTVKQDGKQWLVLHPGGWVPNAAKNFYRSEEAATKAAEQLNQGRSVQDLVPRNPEQVAPFREAGVPGIRYLDQGSRTAGEGSRNYVVFPGNEHLIAILKKYGLPISAAGLAALSQLHPQEAQAAQKQRQ